jgi:nicotinamidase-related amidase
MKIVLPAVAELAARRPEDTVFTRFRAPTDPGQMHGSWRRYFARWPDLTTAAPRHLLELVPQLAALSPPATVFDKSVYSAFGSAPLRAWLRRRGVTCLIVTGVETDVCVLATIISAIDAGYRVVVPVDGVCSSTDTGHDSLIVQYQRRFSQQLEVTNLPTLLHCWG